MLERSCRQGDPLSPYIFSLVIECALEMIRQNADIKGVNIGRTEYKISAYADDVRFNCKWTTKLKVLGVVFANDEKDVYEENFGSKLNAIQTSMNSWRRRYLTLKGRITIIKALLLPKLTHILVSLPKPSKEFMKRLKTIMFHFIWGGKIDRLKRLSICKPYSEGGLAMIEIDTYVEALKTTWVRREMKSNHSWTSLFEERISKGTRREKKAPLL